MADDTREKPVSLRPLSFRQAIRWLVLEKPAQTTVSIRLTNSQAEAVSVRHLPTIEAERELV